MRPRAFWLGGLVGVLLSLLPLAAASKANYTEKLAEAKRFAAEASWALARDAYTEALKLAPDAEAKRWCELWLADVSWRAEGYSRRWQDADRWVTEHTAAFDRLLQPYEHGAPRDAFWQSARLARADWLAVYGRGNPWPDRFAVVDHLAARPPTPEAIAEYLSLLKRFDSPELFRDRAVRSRWLEHLDAASRLPISADERAWLEYEAALIHAAAIPSLGYALDPAALIAERKRVTARWATAIAAAGGTRWESATRVGELIFRVEGETRKPSGQTDPLDVPGMVAELNDLADIVRRTPEDAQLPRVLESLTSSVKMLQSTGGLLDVPELFVPGAKSLFGYGVAGVREIRFTVRRWSAEAWVDRPPSGAGRTQLDERPGVELICDWVEPLANADARNWQSGIKELPVVLAPGFYSLNAVAVGEGPPVPLPRADFLVSAARAVWAAAEAGPDQIGFVDRFSNAPIATATVHGVVATGDRLISWQGTTDVAGRLNGPEPDPKIESDTDVLALWIRDQPVSLEQYHERREDVGPDIDLFVERELFRPGERVHWKGILRDQKSGRFVPPTAGTKVALTVKLANDVIVERCEFTPNTFGTVHGEFVIPAAVAPGWAQMEFETLRPDSEWQEYDSKGYVQIDNFAPPALVAQIECVGDPEKLRPGGELVARTNVRYYSGGPAVDTTVNISFNYDGLLAENASDADREAFAAWRTRIREEPRQARTDPAGNAEARLAIPAFVHDSSWIRMSAEVVPAGGSALKVSTSVAVTTAGAMAWVPDRRTRLVRPGESARCEWSVVDAFGRPRPLTGEIRLFERTWVEVWLDPAARLISGDELTHAREKLSLGPTQALPPPWRKLQAESFNTLVGSQSVEVGDDGRVTADVTIPCAGLFVAYLASDDHLLLAESEQTDRSTVGIVAADHSTRGLMVDPELATIVGPAVMRADAPLTLFVLLPAGQGSGWLVLEGEDRTALERVRFAGRAGFVTIEHPPLATHALNVRLLDDEGSDVGLLDTKVSIPREERGPRLQLELKPDSLVARPGDPTTVRATVRDSDGRPVAAEIAFAASDEAVNQLAQSPWTRTPYFDRAGRVARASIEATPTEVAQPNPPADPRWSWLQGILTRSGWVYPLWAGGDEETIALSPFEVMADGADAYYASNTLAGTRVRTELTESRSSSADIVEGAAEPGASTGRLRQHFSATAVWAPEIVTDERGEASINFSYPDNLTRWRVEAYAVDAVGNGFARAHTLTRTSLPLQARLLTPRLLVAGDTAELSGLIVNRTEADLSAAVALAWDGPLQAVRASRAGFVSVDAPKQGEGRTSWIVGATGSGVASLKLTAEAGTENDAMQLTLPIVEGGIVQETAASSRLAGTERRRSWRLVLPERLDLARSMVTVQLSANHAATLLDALPYLIDYPYGCVEQTMNRFLPAVVVKKTLVDLGLDQPVVEKRVLDGRSNNFAKLDDVMAQSLSRLTSARIADQGFGWWPGATTPDLWMTAYVAWGLALAREGGIEVPARLAEGMDVALLAEIDMIRVPDDRMAWALATLARRTKDVNDKMHATFARAYAVRDTLSAAGRASLALAAVKFGDDEQRAVLLRNLENGAQRVKSSDLGDTVHWGATGDYWRARDGAVESTALTLLALLELEPNHPLIEPAVNWLVLNRRSAHWASTRDTAFAILALTKYIALRGELDADAEVDAFVNGKKVQRVRFTRESLLAGDTTSTIDPKLLRGGTNTFELRRVSGKSPVYAVALASAWAPADAVKPQGHLINVARGFVRQKQEPTLLGTLRITPEPLPADGKANAAVTGEQVTARVTLHVPNELEYVMVEVPKPAGCEPLNPLSGYDARLRSAESGKGEGASGGDDGRAIYREEHDDKSVFFIDALAAGTWEIVFSLRATTPGDYRALPVEASAMYVPEVRANSDAQRVRIERRMGGN